MQRDNEPFEMLILDRYTGEITDKIDQAQEFQASNAIGYRSDVVLFYQKNIDIGAIVFYNLVSKQVIKSLQVPLFSRNKASRLQLLSGQSGREEILMITFEDGGDVFIDLDREAVLSRFDGQGSIKVVAQLWLEGTSG